jgi:hypothetical protein
LYNIRSPFDVVMTVVTAISDGIVVDTGNLGVTNSGATGKPPLNIVFTRLTDYFFAEHVPG